MKTLVIELKKCKRTGFIALMIAIGVMGAAYAFVNFIVRKKYIIKSAFSSYGYSSYTALRHDYGVKHVRHNSRRMHYLQHGI